MPSFLPGQITGTEGYVGSTASGLMAGLNAVRVIDGQQPVILPQTTMMGALFHYITHADISGAGSADVGTAETSARRVARFQPMKANFGLMPELEAPLRDKRQRHAAYAARAQADLEAMLRAIGEPVSAPISPAF